MMKVSVNCRKARDSFYVLHNGTHCTIRITFQMNLLGPQAERNVMLNMGRSQNHGHDPDDLSLTYPRGEKLVYENEILRLKSENEALQDQLKRSLLELKIFQLKYPSPYKNDHLDEEELQFPKAGGAAISFSYAASLFETYDARIRELEDLVKQQKMKLDALKEKMEILIQENEELRENQVEGFKATPFSNAPQHLGMNPSGPINSELVNDLNERISILMDANALLVEQKALLSNELDRQQRLLGSLERDRADLTASVSRAAAEEQSLRALLQQAERDREQAAARAISAGEQLGRAEADAEALAEQLASCRQRIAEAEDACQELRRQSQQQAARAEDASVAAMRRVRAAEERGRELSAQLQRRGQEADAAAETARKLRAEYASTRQDAEGMLQVMAGLERQLQEYAAREAQVERAGLESKERSQEAQTARDQCQVKEEQFRRELERLQRERKALGLQRREQLREAAERAQQPLQEQVAALERDLEAAGVRAAKLTFEAEQAVRDGKAARDSLARLKQIHEEDRAASQASLRSLGEQLGASSAAREQEAAQRAELQEQNRELRLAVDRLRAQADTHRGQLAAQEQLREAELAGLRGAVRDLQKELQARAQQLQRRTQELQAGRADSQSQAEQLQQRLADEARMHQRQALEAQRLVRDLEAAGCQGDLQSQQLLEALKDKYLQASAAQEGRLRREQDSAALLACRLRNCEAALEEVQEEKRRLVRGLEEGRAALRRLEDEAARAHTTAAELALQLARSHAAQETLLDPAWLSGEAKEDTHD
mmetsp:Transcript_23434/g.32133  ORF Transcript_23434/g.32133 Transcript_23434/m.32133 type:complete len:779 (+) Transcript_23434:364-2700(+)